MNRALVLVMMLLAPIALLETSSAPGSPAVQGCTKVTHASTASPTSRNEFRVSTGSGAAADACTATAFTLVEGACLTFNIAYAGIGVGRPSEPNRWEAYWGLDSQLPNDHGTNGVSNWDPQVAYWRFDSNPNGETISACATANGAGTGTPVAGTYRLVLRQCLLISPSSQFSCSSSTSTGTTYDVNSDLNPTCACSGKPGTGFTANGNPGVADALYNPDLHDPLYFAVPAISYVGEAVNYTVGARFDYGDFRTGAASDIHVYVKAPDLSYLVNGANPTESSFTALGGGVRTGYYHGTFTPTAAGDYLVFARLASDDRSSIPVILKVIEKPETRADAEQREARILGAIQYLTSEARNVTGVKVSDGSITSATIATNAIGADEIAADAIGASELAAGAIGASEIGTDAIGADEFAQGAADKAWTSSSRSITDKAGFSLTSDERDSIAGATWAFSSRGLTDEAGFTLASGSIAAATFATGAITADAIAADAIGASEMAAGAIGGDELTQAAADKAWTSSSRVLTDKTGFSLTNAEHDSIASTTWSYSTRGLTDEAGFTLAAGSIAPTTFATGAITADAIAMDAIGASELAMGAIGADELAQAAADKAWTSSTRSLSDKTGFELTSAERDAIAAVTWTEPIRTITGGSIDGDLTQAHFDDWATGDRTRGDEHDLRQSDTHALLEVGTTEGRERGNKTNSTLEEIRLLGRGTALGFAAVHTQMANETQHVLSYSPAAWAESGWAKFRPHSTEEALLLLAALVMLSFALLGHEHRMRWRASWMVASLLCLGAYSWAAAVFA